MAKRTMTWTCYKCDDKWTTDLTRKVTLWGEKQLPNEVEVSICDKCLDAIETKVLRELRRYHKKGA